MDITVTKYEKARILGWRAAQISNGAHVMTEIGDLRDPLQIAIKEYKEGVIPINIIRTLPNGKKLRLVIVPKNT